MPDTLGLAIHPGDFAAVTGDNRSKKVETDDDP
jgi:hypothetical protein